MRGLGWKVLGLLAILLSWHIDTWHTPNPTSRALLTIALVEDHSYAVDRFKDWTEDKALVRGHYYSDKAPLASWIAAPLYAATAHLQGDARFRSPFPAYSALASGAIVSGIVPSLLFALVLWASLCSTGASPGLSVLYLVCALPCSLLGVYSGTFFGHILSGLFLVLAWRSAFHRSSSLATGLYAGFAALAEFPLLVFAPFLLLGCARRPGGRWTNELLRFGLGMLPGLLLIGLHNGLTTGNPLEFAYKHVASESFSHMKRLYGFGAPNLHALWDLLLSPERGLFFYLPLAGVLALFGFSPGGTWREAPGIRTLAFLTFLLLVSSYRMWEGGWALGPRHLIPLAMVLVYEGSLLVPRRATRAWTWALSLAATFGGILIFTAKATRLYMVPQNVRFPLLDLFIPRLIQGELNPNVLPTMLWGAHPLTSHLAWLALLLLGTGALHRSASNIPHPGSGCSEQEPRQTEETVQK